MSEISKDQFLNEYSRALVDGNAALFAGAGTSAGSGMVDWRGLLRDIAKGLGLDVDEESDLIGLAQYEHNNALLVFLRMRPSKHSRRSFAGGETFQFIPATIKFTTKGRRHPIAGECSRSRIRWRALASIWPFRDRVVR